MSHDPKRGKGNWRGCHSFRNIICDGRFDQITVPRQGGLKLGGRYYYYVSLYITFILKAILMEFALV